MPFWTNPSAFPGGANAKTRPGHFTGPKYKIQRNAGHVMPGCWAQGLDKQVAMVVGLRDSRWLPARDTCRTIFWAMPMYGSGFNRAA